MEDLVVSSSVESQELRRLLNCLEREDCVHSWRNFSAEGTLDQLVAWENRLRPTKIFFFHQKQGAEWQMLGASTVAARLTADFPHEGFCVLSRCYIMPECRGRGLYRRLLHYRMEYCAAALGDALNGIHIGSVDRRVSCVLSDHRLPGWPTFTHLGEQELRISGELRTVAAYMLLMPRYVRRLQSELAVDRAPESMVELRRALANLEAGGSRGLGLLVHRAFEEARGEGYFVGRGSTAIEQLLLFCRSLPLVGLT